VKGVKIGVLFARAGNGAKMWSAITQPAIF